MDAEGRSRVAERSVDQRLSDLERAMHEPYGFGHLIRRIDAIESAARVALGLPIAAHQKKQAEYAMAKLAWEKIKDNLRDRSLFDFEDIPALMREIDEEQIEVIRMHMGGNVDRS